MTDDFSDWFHNGLPTPARGGLGSAYAHRGANLRGPKPCLTSLRTGVMLLDEQIRGG